MIDKDIFAENKMVTIEYRYGPESLRVDRGQWTFFSSELPEEPYTRYDGVILTPVVNVYSPFPTEIWIPFDNITAVTYKA